MDDETRRLLKEVFDLEKENQVVLNKLLSYQRWARIWSFLKFVIVVGSVVGIYYYFQPVFSALTSQSANISKAFYNSIEMLSGDNFSGLGTTTTR